MLLSWKMTTPFKYLRAIDFYPDVERGLDIAICLPRGLCLNAPSGSASELTFPSPRSFIAVLRFPQNTTS